MKTIAITPRFIIDSKGHKKEVVIPIKQFDEVISLIEDVLDVQLIEATEGDATISLGDYIEKRKRVK